MFYLIKSALQLFFVKNMFKVCFNCKLSGVSQTSCARLVRVLIVVALCEVGYMYCKMIRQVICWYASVFCILSYALRCCRGLPNSLEKEVFHCL